jgi:hypothetical protein
MRRRIGAAACCPGRALLRITLDTDGAYIHPVQAPGFPVRVIPVSDIPRPLFYIDAEVVAGDLPRLFFRMPNCSMTPWDSVSRN